MSSEAGGRRILPQLTAHAACGVALTLLFAWFVPLLAVPDSWRKSFGGIERQAAKNELPWQTWWAIQPSWQEPQIAEDDLAGIRQALEGTTFELDRTFDLYLGPIHEIHEQGFPWRALSMWTVRRSLSSVDKAEWALELPFWYRNQPSYLPLRPLVLGLAGDIVVWALFSFVTSLAAARTGRAARAFLRRRRGRCARCGYPLGGLSPGSPCPECGDRL